MKEKPKLYLRLVNVSLLLCEHFSELDFLPIFLTTIQCLMQFHIGITEYKMNDLIVNFDLNGKSIRT